MNTEELKEKLLLMREAMPQGCIIMHQENSNCPQFTNQVTNPVFVFEGGTYYGNGTNKPQAPKSQSATKEAADTENSTQATAKPAKKKTVEKADKQHGLTRPTFTRGRTMADYHLQILHPFLINDGWISGQTGFNDFKALFSGMPSDCEVIWVGKGLGDLVKLFKCMQDEALIELPEGARSVNSVLENHFVDQKGHYVRNLNSSKESLASDCKIKEYIKMLKTVVKKEDIGDFIKKQFEDIR